MKKTLLTVLPLAILATSCFGPKAPITPKVIPPTVSEITGIEPSYSADRTDFMGTKYNVHLTDKLVVLSRTLNPSSGEGSKLSSEFNPLKEKITRRIHTSDSTSYVYREGSIGSEVYQKGRVSENSTPLDSMNQDISYNVARLADLEVLRDMHKIKPDTNLVILRNLYGPDQ